MKELERLLREKENKILEEKYPLENKIEVLRPIYDKIKFRNYNSINEISNKEFFAILMETLNPNYSDEIVFIEGVNNISPNTLDDLATIFYQLQKTSENRNNPLFNISKEKKQDRILKKIYDSQKIFTDETDLQNFINIFNDIYSEELTENDLIVGLLYFIAFKQSVSNHKDDIKELQDESREIRRLLSQKNILNKIYLNEDIEDYLKKICEHFEKLDLEQENFKRQQRRKLTSFKKILYTLEPLLSRSYITIKEDLKNLISLDEEIKNVVLKTILEHNEKEYDNLKRENNINNNNSISQLEKLLFDYNINPDLIPSDKRILLLQNKSIDELEDILETLKNPLFSFLNITNPYYIDVLLYSNSNILKEIINYNKNAIVRDDFLQKNIGILIPSDNKEDNYKYLFYIFNENVKTLDKYRIKWNELTPEQINVTLTDPLKLKEILSSLEKYFIPFNQQACYFFLEHPELINYIDSYIELDLYNLLIDEPEDLTIEDVLKRITLLKSIDSPIVNENGYIPNTILTGKNFYVSNDNLSDYIINHTEYFIDKNAKQELDSNDHYQISSSTLQVNEIINLENNFKFNDLMYSFDGIIISRPKVLRCFEFLSKGNYNVNNNLFSSILYNSNLSFDEINQIKNLLFGKKLN